MLFVDVGFTVTEDAGDGCGRHGVLLSSAGTEDSAATRVRVAAHTLPVGAIGSSGSTRKRSGRFLLSNPHARRWASMAAGVSGGEPRRGATHAHMRSPRSVSRTGTQ